MQIKKPAIHDAILDSAAKFFTRQGYHRTTLAAIAEGAGIGVGSIYSYFPSKLHILYQIYRPWFTGCLDDLGEAIDAAATPRERLRCFLLGIWRDIPARNTGLANSLMEALASADPGTPKPDDLLPWSERRLSALLRQALPAERHALLKRDFLSHLLLMAFDGFVINRRLGDMRDVEAITETVCDMLLGPAVPARRSNPAARPRGAGDQGRRSRKTA